MDLTETELDRLQYWIDLSKHDLRMLMCENTNGTTIDAMRETQGMTRGELIRRWVEEYGI